MIGKHLSRLAVWTTLVVAGSLLSGCAQGAKDEYHEIKDSSVGQAASKAYNVFNFAMNATNPLYYAGKAASAGYEKYKESKDNSGSGE